MGKIKIEIHTDNDAFEGPAFGMEVNYIIAVVAAKMAANRESGRLRDTNGNIVGFVKVTK